MQSDVYSRIGTPSPPGKQPATRKLCILHGPAVTATAPAVIALESCCTSSGTF